MRTEMPNTGAQQEFFGLMEAPVSGEVAPSNQQLDAPVSNEVVYQHSLRAKHYRLTLQRDGTAVATIPKRGSQRGAQQFVEQHREWLERERLRQARRPRAAEVWVIGTHVLWR